MGVFHVTLSYTNPHSTKGTRSNDKYYLVSFDVFNGKYMISGIAESEENEGHRFGTVTDADVLDKIDKLVDKSSPEYIAYKAYEEYIDKNISRDGQYFVGDGVFAFIDDDEFPEYIISVGRLFQYEHSDVYATGKILSYQSDGSVREMELHFPVIKDILQDGVMVDKARSGKVLIETTSTRRSGARVDVNSEYKLYTMPDSLDTDISYKDGSYSTNDVGAGIFIDEGGVETNLSGFQEYYFRSFPCAFWELMKNNYDVEFVTD